MHLDDRFDPLAVRTFERAFATALTVEVFAQVRSGVWRVHEGALYPWRHLGIVPLAPPALALVEWIVVTACALALFAAPSKSLRARAWQVLAPVLLWSVLQRFSNHGALFFLVALFVSMSPSRPYEKTDAPNFGLVRAQLVIVYVFSALAKLLHGFGSGASLANLFGWSPGLARGASWVVIAAELTLPVLVITRPKLGVGAVAIVHLGFALLLPNVTSFGLCMFAMAVLWVRPTSRSSPAPAGPSPSPSDREASDALPPLQRT